MKFTERQKGFGLAVLLVLGLLAWTFRYMDLLGDTFWSIASGRVLLLHKVLPTRDSLTFTAGPDPWIVHMPLAQVLLALLEAGSNRALGVSSCGPGALPPAPAGTLLALVVFGTLIKVLSLGILLFAHAKTVAKQVLGFVLLLGLVWLERDDLSVRGQLFGDVAFASLLGSIFQIRAGAKVAFWVPVLLGSLWVNLHSSYFLSFVLPGFYATLLALVPASRREARVHATFAGLSFVGSLINPYAHRLPLDLARLLLAKSTSQIDLFLPPDLSDFPIVVTGIGLFVVVLTFLRRQDSKPDALALLGFICASSVSRRYVPLAFAFAVVLLLRSNFTFFERVMRPWVGGVLGLVVIVLGLRTTKDPYRDVPVEEAALIEKLGLPDFVANIYHWGGYLDYAWRGRRSVFIDGRNQLFDNGTFDASTRLLSGDHIDETLWAYRINTVLWERGSVLDGTLRKNPEWSLVHEGRIAVLYTRRVPIKSVGSL